MPRLSRKQRTSAAPSIEEHNRVLRLAEARALKLEDRLVAILEPILNRAGDEAASAFSRMATDHATASGSRRQMPGFRDRLMESLAWQAEHPGERRDPPAHIQALIAASQPGVKSTSTMICLKPTPEEAGRIAKAGALDASTLHVTLAYLGDVEGDLEPVVAAIRAAAAVTAPLRGVVGGVGLFAAGPDGAPVIALPDVPGLVELRVAVTEALVEAGIGYSRDHGFCAHMTLDYVPIPDSGFEGDMPFGEPLTFDQVYVVRGDVEVHPIPLVGRPPLTAAAPPPPAWGAPAADEVIDVDRLVKSLRTKTDPVRLAVIETTMKKSLNGAGIDFDVTNPLTAKVLSQSASQVTNIAETTRLNVMKTIKASYDEGLTIPDTATAIRAGMREASPARARLIARTELVGAVNGGSLAATQIVSDATGLNYDKEWMTAPGAPNPRHELVDGLDGQTVPLEATFDVEGEALEFPGDPSGSPENICNCRCTMSYVEPGGQVVDAGDAESGIMAPEDVAAAEGGDIGGLGGIGGEGLVPVDALPPVPAPIDLGGGIQVAPVDYTALPGEYAPDVMVPSSASEAAGLFMEGVARSEMLAGKVSSQAERDTGMKNWLRHLRRDGVFDESALSKVREADAYNQGSAVYRAQVARYGRDAVVVVKDTVKPGTPLYPGRDMTAAARLTGNRVTVILEDTLTRSVDTGLRPGVGSSTDGGVQAVIRHEYGHQIDESLTADQKASFRADLPAASVVREDLTLYAKSGLDVGNAQEAFSELFAVVSDPAYDPALWSPWVRDLGAKWFDAPLERVVQVETREALTDRWVTPVVERGEGVTEAEVARVQEATSQAFDRLTAFGVKPEWPSMWGTTNRVEKVVATKGGEGGEGAYAVAYKNTIGWNVGSLDEMAANAAKDAKTIADGGIPFFQQADMADVMIHEVGHLAYQSLDQAARDAWEALWERKGREDIGVSHLPSFYAQESKAEAWAETFTALVRGRAAGSEWQDLMRSLLEKNGVIGLKGEVGVAKEEAQVVQSLAAERVDAQEAKRALSKIDVAEAERVQGTVNWDPGSGTRIPEELNHANAQMEIVNALDNAVKPGYMVNPETHVIYGANRAPVAAINFTVKTSAVYVEHLGSTVKGGGTELLRVAAKRAVESGADYVHLQAVEEQIGFYEKLGFRVLDKETHEMALDGNALLKFAGVAAKKETVVAERKVVEETSRHVVVEKEPVKKSGGEEEWKGPKLSDDVYVASLQRELYSTNNVINYMNRKVKAGTATVEDRHRLEALRKRKEDVRALIAAPDPKGELSRVRNQINYMKRKVRDGSATHETHVRLAILESRAKELSALGKGDAGKIVKDTHAELKRINDEADAALGKAEAKRVQDARAREAEQAKAVKYSSPSGVASLLIDQPIGTVIELPAHDVMVGAFAYKAGRLFAWIDKSGVVIKREASDVHDTATGFAQKDAEQTASAYLESVPESMQGELQMITLANGYSPSDSYFQQAYKGFSHAAAQGAQAQMWFWQGYKTTFKSTTFDHEMGHIVGDNSGPRDIIEWSRAQTADQKSGEKLAEASLHNAYRRVLVGQRAVTEYGSNNDMEDWAESVRLWLESRREGRIASTTNYSTGQVKDLTFADVFPARAKILDREFGP